MLIIGNSNLCETNLHGEGHWIFQLADHLKKTPKVIVTSSNEETHSEFLENHSKYKDVFITIPDLVHQQIGNMVYHWGNEKYLDINHSRRRDLLLMSHTPTSMINHNTALINSIKAIRKDVKIASEWAQISPCVAEKLLDATTTPYYNKKALNGQFIRWCEIHNADISTHESIDNLIDKSDYYNSDFTYTQAGHNAIFSLITTL